MAVCVAWLLFVLLHRFLSDRVYWWGPPDLIPPLAFLVMPLLLLGVAQFTGRHRRVVTAVPVLALLLGVGYSGLNAATLWYTPPTAPANAIKVVTWNTEYWDQDLRPGGPRTTEDFYRFLRGLNADVYLLHEYAHVDFTLADVFAQAQSIDQEALLRASFPGYEIRYTGRSMTLSRLPILSSQWLDSTPWLPTEFRDVPAGLRTRPLFYKAQTLRTDILVNGQTVSFYNCHLFQPPVRILLLRGDPGQSMFEIDRFNFSMRRASLRAVAADVARNPNRILLAGDLNTTPSMNILDMIPDRLVDQTRALSSLYPVTWREGTLSRLWRIDWLFTTPDVAVHDYSFQDPKGLSDHRVQRAVISVK